MKTPIRAYYLVFAFLLFSPFGQAAELQVEGGLLIGARNVNVNGQLFDVVFLDGTCAELYDGCDQNSDFPLTNPLDLGDQELIHAAHTALLDQVFIDGPQGNFDTVPNLTRGCTAPGGCYVFTPFFVNVAGGIGSYSAFNRNNLDGDVVGSGGGLDIDTRLVPEYTRAVWTRASPVPEPSTWVLMVMGLLGLVSMGRRKSS